ncbi:MAG TPA: putative toxin-antitoxin system toxin component, PIN family [Gemmatimonadales bacterium]|nr:putative toxin-antitoxin system toxin component, PIN family [Gemmatimonadales bacterium]
MDTNVLVSAMLNGGGAPDQVLQAALQGTVLLLADSRILAEYDEVTACPAFRFDETERRALLDALERIAEPVVAAPMRLTLPDPDDRMFVEVALAGRADAIVTGNTRHFVPRKGPLDLTILTPGQLVDRLRT